jgi:hypothetical protein
MALSLGANRWYTWYLPVKTSRFLVPALLLLPVIGALGYFFVPWRDITEPLPFPVSQGVPESRFARMGMGVNMAGWFAQRTEYPIDDLKRHHTTAELDAFVEMGVRHVRLPFEMEAFGGTVKNLKVDEKRFKVFENVIRGMSRRGILVMVFFHPPETFKKTLENDPIAFAEVVKMWDFMSKRLGKFSPEEIVFEPLSEPNYKNHQQWARDQLQLIRVIRKNCPMHTIVAQGGDYSTAKDLIQLRPYKDMNLVYTFHFYEPFLFTHQGANWVDPNVSGFGIVRYPSTPENIKTMESRIRNSGQASYFQAFDREAPWNRETLRRRVSVIDAWQKKYGVKVICNEFGLPRETLVSVDRAAWFKDIALVFREKRIPWSSYEWMGGMGLIYDRITKKEGFESIDRPSLEALGFKMPTYQPLGESVKDFTGAVAK